MGVCFFFLTFSEETDLFFGTKRDPAPAVTEAQFRTFVDTFVTPRFPYGLTWFATNGQWSEDGTSPIKEDSFDLVLYYPTSARDSDVKIQEIRAEWKRLYDQTSVLRADTTAKVSF